MPDSLVGPGVITHTGSGFYSLPETASACIPSADYKSVDPTAVEFGPVGATGLQILLNVTAQTGAGNTITINVDVFDPVSNTWIPVATTFTFATGAAGTKVFNIDPRMTAVANQVVQGTLGQRMRIRPVGSGTRTTLNYSIGFSLSN